MTVFQIISVLFALFMMYVVQIHGKKKNLSHTEVLGWNAVWIAFVVVALFPDLLLGITDLLKFGRVFDLLIVIAFMIVSIVVFLSYFTVRSLQKKIEDAVRSEALRTGKRTVNEKK